MNDWWNRPESDIIKLKVPRDEVVAALSCNSNKDRGLGSRVGR